MPRHSTRALICSVAVAACLGLPSSASAASVLYVDDGGTDSGFTNNCQNPNLPCKTIDYALAISGAGATVNVGGGIYNENVYVSGGRSVVKSDFKPPDTGGPAVIAPFSSGNAVTVSTSSSDASQSLIQGLRIRSPDTAALTFSGSSGTATVSGDTFDSPNSSASPPAFVYIPSSSGSSPTISGNTFTDTHTTSSEIGVEAQGTGTPTIEANTFDGMATAVAIQGTATVRNNTITNASTTENQEGVTAFSFGSGTATISGNTFDGMFRAVDVLGETANVRRNTITHTYTGQSQQGEAIRVDVGGGTVHGNVIEHPVGSAWGILVASTSASTVLSDNTLIGNITDARQLEGGRISVPPPRIGIDVVDTTGPVNSNSDLVTHYGTGVHLVDSSSPPAGSEGDATFDNLTAFGNTTDVQTSGAALTLDSGIVGNAISSLGGGTCSITYSRGPVATPGGDGCGDFQTTADPMFVNPANDDYHLAIGSPMIDAGDPAAPSSGATDIDGDARALDSNCDAVQNVVRDVGADELAPNCNPPNTLFRIGSTGATTTDRTPTFKFRANSNTAGTRFRCKRDDGLYKFCTSPKTFINPFGPGRHVFRVKAINPFGIPDTSPAKQVFHVLP
jgi:hypothetical protein